MIINKLLIRSYSGGVRLGGGRLTSHHFRDAFWNHLCHELLVNGPNLSKSFSLVCFFQSHQQSNNTRYKKDLMFSVQVSRKIHCYALRDFFTFWGWEYGLYESSKASKPRFVSVSFSTPHPCSSSELMSGCFFVIFFSGWFPEVWMVFFCHQKISRLGNLGFLGEVGWFFGIGPKNPSTWGNQKRASWIRILKARFVAARTRTWVITWNPKETSIFEGQPSKTRPKFQPKGSGHQRLPGTYLTEPLILNDLFGNGEWVKPWPFHSKLVFRDLQLIRG